MAVGPLVSLAKPVKWSARRLTGAAVADLISGVRSGGKYLSVRRAKTLGPPTMRAESCRFDISDPGVARGVPGVGQLSRLLP